MKAYYYIVYFFILGLASCRRDNSMPQTFTKDSYPLAIGNSWQYQTTSCLGFGTDTIMLKIISTSNAGPYTKYECYFLYAGAVTDSGYFLQSDTSLSFTISSPYADLSPFPNFYLRLPAYTGQYWQGAFKRDSTKVVGVAGECVGTNSGFGPCYSTVESYDLPHNFLVKRMLLTPKVGIVSGDIDFVSDTAEINGNAGVDVCSGVNLISYHVQ